MKRNWIARPAAAMLVALIANAADAARPVDGGSGSIPARVEALLRQMTLDEKVGQLNQLSDKEFLTGPQNPARRDLHKDIRSGKVGSMLNVKGALDTRAVQALAMQSRLKIPLLFGLDVIHGYQTVFPVPLGEAASWDLEAIEQSARIAAREAASSGIHWTFAPMVDMSEQQLHESYLPPFKAALDAGAATFMNAFNTLNGVPATASSVLQRDILKGAWGFKGFVVSDWGSVREMVVHGYASDLPDAAARAIVAGSDMDMESNGYASSLAQLVRAKRVDVALVDDAVRRILTKKFELGLFDDPYRFSDVQREKAALSDPAHRAAARAIAAKSMVLLKNENAALPIKRGIASIAVIGPLADAKRDLEGGWLVKSAAARMTSLVDAIRSQAGPGTRVSFAAGCTVACTTDEGFAAAIEAARGAEVVVLAVGESWDMTGEAKSRSDIGLPGRQGRLFDALRAAGKTPVVVVMAGRPLVFENLAEGAKAILYAWFPGSEGGNAIADVLFGAVNPSPKLPMTFPRNVGQIPISYQQYQTGRPVRADGNIVYKSAYIDSPNTPRYAFGHGLSYTSFDYRDLRLSGKSMRADGSITLSFTLANTGPVAGAEVVQLYLRDPVSSIVRPLQELKGFKKVMLQPGQQHRVEFTIGRDSLAFVNHKLERVAEPGQFQLMVGAASNDIRLRETIQLTD